MFRRLTAVGLSLAAALALVTVASAAIPPAERDALIALYSSTNGSGWLDGTDWLGPAGSECEWYGVGCDAAEAHVTSLALGGNQLIGPLPAELGDLTQLETLQLDWNQLTGTIPPTFGNLSQLTLVGMAYNQLNGSIPPELGSLQRLTSLDIGSNQLSGPIPPQLGNLSQLEWMAFPMNQLTGVIPSSLAQLGRLRLLHLWGNQLEGAIPAGIAQLGMLESLDLHQNRLDGPLPSELGTLVQLQELILSGNRISGEIPASIGDLQALLVLWLDGNLLGGEIPREMINLATLHDGGGLDLCGNALYTDDPELSAFLDTKQAGGDWQGCQSLTGVEPGDENPVSPPDAQVEPSTGAATDNRGNRVVVWSQTSGKLASLDGNLAVQQGAGVFGRAFDPDDNPVGATFQVVGDLQALAINPTVSFDATGSFVVGWEKSGEGIFGRVFDPDLIPVTPVVPVTQAGAPTPDAPEVATASAGDFAMVWRASTAKAQPGGAGIFGRFFAPDGTPYGDPVQVDGGYATAVSTPSVGSDAGGRTFVVWRQEADSKQGGNGIFGRYFGSGGDPQGPEVVILGGQTGVAGSPSVGVDTLGAAVVVWTQDKGIGTGTDIWGQRLDRDGQPVGDAFQVNGEAEGDQVAPSVAVSPVGAVAVAWEKDGEGIFGRFLTSGGTPIGGDFEVALVDAGLLPVEPEVSVAGDNAITVAYAKVDGGGVGQGVFFRTFAVTPPQGSCTADQSTNCLNSDRFQVRVSWRDFQGNSGVGDAVPLTDDTGYFWFFDAANVELMLKVLDGTWLNGNYWVFFGALSNVEYTIVVTDTVTGSSVTYYNPLGNFGSVGDTEAIPGQGKQGTEPVHRELTVPTGDFSLEVAELYGELARGFWKRERPELLQSCTPTATDLCLTGNRFRVSVAWEDFQGNPGVGAAVPLTSDTGYFWFFDDANVELVVKVLDGTWLNGHYWVFYGSLSNVEYTLTVTDTETGLVKTYTNPSGNFGSVGDTEAFAVP